MFKNLVLDKTQVLIGIFTLIILIFMGVIFYQLVNFGKEEEPVAPPVKTKAAGKTYRKEIALNIASSPTPSLEEPTPTQALETISPTEALSSSPTLIARNEGVGGGGEEMVSTGEPEVSITPTPSDIIVAKISPTQEAAQESSPTPTGVKSLPKAGYFYYNIFLFAIGAFIIVFSLVI